MRRRITLLVVTALTAAAMTVGGAGAAFADNPHAGQSGHFKGSAKQCDRDHPKCPPFGG
jgi:hypothetical protein